ncbi:MAG: hypothetical protein WCV85_00170 [Patescibacteria group bacterium]
MRRNPPRPLGELTARASIALARDDLVRIVQETSSPTAAFDLAKQITGDSTLAKATRWLATIKRDYGVEAFNAICQKK